MRKCANISSWEGCQSYMTLHCSILNFLIYKENFILFFISVICIPCRRRRMRQLGKATKWDPNIICFIPDCTQWPPGSPLSIGLTCRVSTPHHIWACGPHRMWDWKLKYHIFSLHNMYNKKGIKFFFLYKRYFINVLNSCCSSRCKCAGGGWHQHFPIKCRYFNFFSHIQEFLPLTAFPYKYCNMYCTSLW